MRATVIVCDRCKGEHPMDAPGPEEPVRLYVGDREVDLCGPCRRALTGWVFESGGAK